MLISFNVKVANKITINGGTSNLCYFFKLNCINLFSAGLISDIDVEIVTLPKISSRSKLQFFKDQLLIFSLIFIKTLVYTYIRCKKCQTGSEVM